MIGKNLLKKYFLSFAGFWLLTGNAVCSHSLTTDPTKLHAEYDGKKIRNIIVQGNKYVKADAILRRSPYKAGGSFDPKQSSTAIHNIYDLGRFRQVAIDAQKVTAETIDVYIVVEEKKLLEKIDFKGNRNLKSKQIKEKLHLDKLATIDEETLYRVADKIKKIYAEDNRHEVEVSYKIIPNKENPDKATARFTIQEGRSAKVKRVHFIGNKAIPSRKLASVIFTRENWLLNFLDGSGVFSSEMLEMDRHRLEYFYRDHGYMMAKVSKGEVKFDATRRDIEVTFHIVEGDCYTVNSLDVIGDEIHDAKELLPLIVLELDKPFCQSNVVKSINRMKDLYGEQGYIDADIYPQVKPNEETKTVDITFNVDRAKKLYSNRISITGNKVTRDKVIRRQLEIVEGELVTTRKLKASQSAVEFLGFFEHDGANWRIHRVAENQADLEMNVQETKTGNFNVSLSYGTDQYNPTPSLRGTIALQKSNMFGQGWDLGGMLQANRHRIKKCEANFFDPHIFDSDVSMGINLYKRWDEFEQWTTTNVTPIQRVLGADFQFGFWLPKVDKRLKLVLDIGFENIDTNNPHARGQYRDLLEPIVKRTFEDGFLNWIGLQLLKDTRDHPVFPTTGYRMSVGSQAAFPFLNKKFSYLKSEMEGSYYTPLIGSDKLVLCLHGKMGNIRSITAEKTIPYKELYHMGGQSTVRGFVFGGIGPAWITGDPLGAQDMLQFNTEFIFPLIPDYSMKAHFFYDAGAGWDTPKKDIQNTSLIQRDKFDLRHSVGFGLKLVKPMPAQIDWGFKLDRKKDRHESPSEFHLSMNYAW